MVSDNLQEYLRGFARAGEPWPELPRPDPVGTSWWREFLGRTAPGERFVGLREGFPQLWLPTAEGQRQSPDYQRLVLRGEAPTEEVRARAPALRDPEGLSISLEENPCGAMPVLRVRDREDFLFLLHALAHHGEPVKVGEGVHAQALGGVIHWGIVHAEGPRARARLILLHHSPYGSVPASEVPGEWSEEGWSEASDALRLEHELTHQATKALLGEMRINLLDELVADTMGMIHALGFFDAELFRKCLGARPDGTAIPGARLPTYTAGLGEEDAANAVRLCLERAAEIEAAGRAGRIPADRWERLRWLVGLRLDLPVEG